MNFLSILLTTTSILVLASSASAQKKKVSILADPWCPYTCEATGDKPGFLIDAAKIALAGTDYEVDYQIMPWARVLSDVRAGKINGAAGATETDKDGMTMSPPLISSASCFYGKKSFNWKFDGEASLANVTLGTVVGYTYDEKVDGYIEKNKGDAKKIQMVSGDNPLPQNIKKLQSDRIQLMIEDKNVVDYYFANNGGAGDIEAKSCLDPADVFIAFGAKNPMTPELVKAFSAGFAKAKGNGELAKAMAKYGLK